MTILDEILAKKREEVEALGRPLVHAEHHWVLTKAGRRSLRSALTRPPGAAVRVLAEIKFASPSAGKIRDYQSPNGIAVDYEAAGAAAISILTDRTFFAGDIRFLHPCRRSVKVPILRKDFLIAPVQLFESAVNGADAVLLIVAALQPHELGNMLRVAEEYGLEALVETHTLAEADAALAAGATLLGVNHRDLHTFAIDMSLTEQIAKRVPSDVVLVAESGIRTRDDVRRLGDAGAHAVLVGEHLMRAPSPGAALRELLS